MLLLFIFGLLSALPAENTVAARYMADYPPSNSGDYVVYRDYTWKEPTWVGFLYYDDSTWGAVVVTPSTGTNVSILFRVETTDGKMVLTGQNIISQITPDDVATVNYLMSLLPEMYTWRNSTEEEKAQRQTTNSSAELLPASVRISRTVATFGGDVSFAYAPEIPVFNLHDITAADGAPVLELARLGRIQSGGESAFFSFTPMPKAKAGTTLALSTTRKSESRLIDGITLSLDDQWKMIADNTFFLGNAAMILVDTIDLNILHASPDNLPLTLVRFFSLSRTGSWSVPAAFSITGTRQRFRIINLFYDCDSGTLTRDIKTCIPSKDGKTCVVISLTVSETAYKANKDYFDGLLNSGKQSF